MPAAAIYNKDWIGGEGMEMTAIALRKVKAHIEKGDDVRIRSMIAGIARCARVSQGTEEHGRTGPDVVTLSVIIFPTVTDGECLLNPLIELAGRHGAIFASRAGFAHDTIPTVSDLFLIDPDGDKNDLAMPQSNDLSVAETNTPDTPSLREPVVLGGVSSYTPFQSGANGIVLEELVSMAI